MHAQINALMHYDTIEYIIILKEMHNDMHNINKLDLRKGDVDNFI